MSEKTSRKWPGNRAALGRVRALALVLVLPAAAQPDRAALEPVPLVRPPTPLPGEVQPIAPGVRPAPTLPRLQLSPPVPELQRLEYRGNGFIEVAHGLLLLDPGQQSLARQRALAAQVVRGAFAARPSLAEVDVSLYDRASYGGFGGPLPLFTASVPRDRLGNFTAYTAGRGPYERVYEGGGTQETSPTSVFGGLEEGITFLGTEAELLAQRVEQSLSQFRGGVRGGLLFRGSLARPLAALTFDDAPHPLYEPLLLDLLRRAGVKATFFVIGRNAVAYPYFVRDMVEGGHEAGNHTYHHVRLPGLSEAQVRFELAQANRVISAITGRPVRYFRPPGGDYSPLTLRIAGEEGLVTTFWTDDPGDFANPGDAVVESRLVRHLRRGGIVLLHDNAPEGIDVLSAFLRVARSRGVDLTTVSDLAGK
ncbi:polysaccharide deacetylase family protein [Deinococcus apachensis]|uniref:polysaccharide deacetylase family protein n=1 Tax=Deinococcus apachensis TaxID=309886 RepID=UPI00035D1D3E|nr:polysaccharide deacetylase family protein [Deinococcus apachensis]